MKNMSYKTPNGLIAEQMNMNKFKIIRFHHPTAKMEMSLLYGKCNDVLQNLTATSVSFYLPKEQEKLTQQDKETLGNMVLAGIRTDLNLELVGECANDTLNPGQLLGQTKNGYFYIEEKLTSSGDVVQCTTIIFDTNSDTVAVIGYRTSRANKKDADCWKEKLLNSIMLT